MPSGGVLVVPAMEIRSFARLCARSSRFVQNSSHLFANRSTQNRVSVENVRRRWRANC